MQGVIYLFIYAFTKTVSQGKGKIQRVAPGENGQQKINCVWYLGVESNSDLKRYNLLIIIMFANVLQLLNNGPYNFTYFFIAFSLEFQAGGRHQNITPPGSWPSDRSLDNPILQVGKMKKGTFLRILSFPFLFFAFPPPLCCTVIQWMHQS